MYVLGETYVGNTGEERHPTGKGTTARQRDYIRLRVYLYIRHTAGRGGTTAVGRVYEARGPKKREEEEETPEGEAGCHAPTGPGRGPSPRQLRGRRLQQRTRRRHRGAETRNRSAFRRRCLRPPSSGSSDDKPGITFCASLTDPLPSPNRRGRPARKSKTGSPARRRRRHRGGPETRGRRRCGGRPSLSATGRAPSRHLPAAPRFAEWRERSVACVTLFAGYGCRLESQRRVVRVLTAAPARGAGVEVRVHWIRHNGSQTWPTAGNWH